jgi:hypothetical protein
MPESRIDLNQIEEQVANQLPFPRDRWSTHLERILPGHVLIHLSIMVSEPGWVLPVIWSKGDLTFVRDLNDWSEFSQLIEDEGLSVEDNLQDILDVFCFFQPYKRVLHSIADLEKDLLIQENYLLLPKYAETMLSKYMGTIAPPSVLLDGGEQQASFWTIDHGSGDLEEWLLVQKGPRVHIQFWIREKHIIGTLLGH